MKCYTALCDKNLKFIKVNDYFCGFHVVCIEQYTKVSKLKYHEKEKVMLPT